MQENRVSDDKTLSERNYEYWLKRAKGYSEVNKEELAGIQRSTWAELLDGEILKHFGISGSDRSSISILDIGAGPGFLSIILTELGYHVTAADMAETMIEEAKGNAGELSSRISFCRENAMDLSFADLSFDVVISRNLTWNLPDPEKAYSEWLRVMKNKGLMLVFDANWYAFLVDENKKAEFDDDRKNVASLGLEDYNIGENFDIMDEIARCLPLTGADRPEWDESIFTKLGVSHISITGDIGSVVYSEKEKVNYASTPMFMIKVVK